MKPNTHEEIILNETKEEINKLRKDNKHHEQQIIYMQNFIDEHKKSLEYNNGRLKALEKIIVLL